MRKIELVTFDMAGTTIEDPGIVESCFQKACERTGVSLTPEKNKSVQGLKKRTVFRMFWKEQLGEEHPDFELKVDESFRAFREILEEYYRNNALHFTDGCSETIKYLNEKGIKVALTTGFYRAVTDLILEKIGWLNGLNEDYIGDSSFPIQASICSDDVENGRPAPEMIHLAMKKLGVSDSKLVVCVGDTPSDLQSGKAADCALTIGLTNGTHSRELLEPFDSDILLDSLRDFPKFIEDYLHGKQV